MHYDPTPVLYFYYDKNDVGLFSNCIYLYLNQKEACALLILTEFNECIEY